MGNVEDTNFVSHRRPTEAAWSNAPHGWEGFGETPEHARRAAEELRRVTLAEEGLMPKGEHHVG